MLFLFILSGCDSLPVSENNHNAQTKPEKESYLGNEVLYFLQKELENSKIIFKEEKSNRLIKWIQPKNKRESCKVFVGSSRNNDYTLEQSYKIYWDGKCKDGFAYGLGREFESYKDKSNEALAEYSGGQNEPKYFMQVRKGERIEVYTGDVNNGIVFGKTLDAKKDEIKEFATVVEPGSVYQKFDTDYIKRIPNKESEIIIGFNESHVKSKIIRFLVVIGNKKYISVYDRGEWHHILEENGIAKRVEMSDDYVKYVTSAYDQIKQKLILVESEYSYSNQKKQQYKDAICKDRVKVDFMPQEKYKEFCDSHEYFNEYMSVKNKIQDEKNKFEQKAELERKLSQAHKEKIEQLANNESQLDANIYWHVSQINEKKLKLVKLSQGSASYTELSNEIAYLTKELAPLEEAKALIKKRENDAYNRKLAQERDYQKQQLQQQQAQAEYQRKLLEIEKEKLEQAEWQNSPLNPINQRQMYTPPNNSMKTCIRTGNFVNCF